MFILHYKTNIFAISSCIASWWQTWRYCQNVGFTIGKPTIWHGHHVSHGYRIGAWGRNRLLFRGLGPRRGFSVEASDRVCKKSSVFKAFLLYSDALLLHFTAFLLYPKAFLLYSKAFLLYSKACLLYSKAFFLYSKAFYMYSKAFYALLGFSVEATDRVCKNAFFQCHMMQQWCKQMQRDVILTWCKRDATWCQNAAAFTSRAPVDRRFSLLENLPNNSFWT